MWDFKFNAPQYYNFFRKEKNNENYEIDLQNSNDLWFLQEHLQLTPMKNEHKYQNKLKAENSQINKKNQIKLKELEIKKQFSKGMDVITGKNENKIKQHRVQKLKRNDIKQKIHITKVMNKKNQFSFKIPQPEYQKQKYTQEIKLDNKRFASEQYYNKIQEKNRKISHTKSEIFVNPHKNKIRIPCPYPRRIQKDWETKSNKSWYSLSKQSAQKALKSMKKINQTKNLTKVQKGNHQK